MSVYYKEQPLFLGKAIQSMLEQTLKPDEFIIVKDGPLGDELEQVIIKYVSNYPDLFTIIKNEKNLGLGPALRKGIEKSRNEYIARMDSDDFSCPIRCQKQMQEFQNHPELGIVGSFEAEFIEDVDNVICIHKKPEKNDEIREYMRRRCAILHPTVMFRKSDVIRAGNYQTSSVYPLYEDYDLFARMVFDANVKCYNIQEHLYFIRISEDFYERRGGLKYAKTVLKFKWHLYRKGNMSLVDFVISGFGQAIICILPNGLRKKFYLEVLRRNK